MTPIIHDNLPPISGPDGGSPDERLLVVCDFDGTVCSLDMGDAFLERFAEGWEEIDRSYSAGEVGSRVAYGRIDFAFPWVSEECGRCGTCKRSLLDRFRSDYDRIIYIGDGYSDVCPARTADQVFAKEVLYEKCVKNGTPCLRYDNFGDTHRCLEKEITDGFSNRSNQKHHQ